MMDSQKRWKSPIEEIIAELKSSDNGLTTKEANERLMQYGQNVIQEKDKKTTLDLLLSQFANPLVIILIVASIISGYLGDVFDTIIILTVVMLSAAFGFIQEYKSEKVLSELKKYFSHYAVVLRDGQKTQIDSKLLVPGDIIYVRLGDILPADVRIIETEGIFVDESILTGESANIEKKPCELTSAATPQDITNGLFMGTTVTEGYAKAVVIDSGENTFFGKTAAVFSSKVPESDFQLGIKKFGNLLIRVIVIITLTIFIVNYVQNHGEKDPLVDSALFALAIAVGIAPEALPAIITITLSNGSLALAKKKVVTKKLAAIEDLGNMDVLCTDKTGTLTEELKVERYVDLDKHDKQSILEYSVLCNAAVGTTHFRGNSVDVAIKKHAKKNNVDVSRFTKLEEIPFDFTRRRMGQIVREGKKTLLIVKGSTESLLTVCNQVHMDTKSYPIKEKIDEIKEISKEYGLSGYTTIGIAVKELKPKKYYSKDDEKELTFLGFLLLGNPPKQSVKHTLERLKNLNVRLKILTGDDQLVTKHLCESIGFVPSENRIMTGTELEEIEESKFSETVEKLDVFARVTPQQKLRIIETLKKNGHVVGFLGDGINDAPSLRTADVGISVDTAADVAKGASHIILLQKSLGVVADGVEEGRRIFGNITKYILNTMSANQGNMITVAVSSFFLPFIPLLPSQILLNNLLSDLPLMTISSDNVDPSFTKKPQKWDIKFISRFMLFFGAISTIFDIIFIALAYFVLGADIATFRTGWFLESVLSEMIIVFSLRTRLPFFKSVPSWLLVVGSLGAAAVSLGIIYFQPIASMFSLVPLDTTMLGMIGLVLIGYFITTEIGKTIFFRENNELKVKKIN